ncbi:MAG: glutamyl-tRNA reductase [Candidatus Sumerlaeia bacterium]
MNLAEKSPLQPTAAAAGKSARRPRLYVCGHNHQTATLALRERFALAPNRYAAELERLHETLGEQLLILSTCNRTEIYAFSARPHFEKELHAALMSLAAAAEAAAAEPLQHKGMDAVRHLFAVGAGLDSMILGENQIKRQLREAYQASRDAKCCGADLSRVMEAALHTAKRIRTETDLNVGTLDVGKAAVLKGEEVLGGLEGRVCMLIGSGAIGSVAARAIAERRPGRLLIVNRTLAHAAPLASELGGEAIPIEELGRVLPEVDFVLGAAAAPALIVSRALWEKAMGGGDAPRPICMVDAAVPRILDPGLGLVKGIRIFDIEHMEEIVARNRERRSCAAERAWTIVEAEVAAYRTAVAAAEVGPMIERLGKRFDELFETEPLGDEAARRLKQRLLHEVIMELKGAISRSHSE